MNKAVTWDRWPHVLETQQFEAEVVETLIAHMTRVELSMMSQKFFKSRKVRLSDPGEVNLKIYFDEESTRTFDSFNEAGRRLGWNVSSLFGGFSSAIKGESLADTVMAITQTGGMGYLRSADMLVVRGSERGSAHIAAKVVEAANKDDVDRLPLAVISAGDGAGQHPTQAFVDLVTIYRERTSKNIPGHPLDDFTIVIAGDTFYSRTVNSLVHLLGKFGETRGIRIIFSSHPAIKPKEDLLAYLSRHGVDYEIEEDFSKAIKEADAVYMTRIQKKRYEDTDLYQSIVDAQGRYSFRPEHENMLKPGAFVMHPLPIARHGDSDVPEIDPSLQPLAYENHPVYAWARQSHRGVPVRFALLDMIQLGIQENYK